MDPDNPSDVSDLVERLGDELQDVIKRAMHDFDPMAVSALRVGHAILVAVRRNDKEALEALRAWQDQTLDYMQLHAFDEYLTMPLPPRPARDGRPQGERHDRHLIVAALKGRIKKYLEQRDRERRLPPSGTLEELVNKNEDARRLLAMVHRCFPNLKPDDDNFNRRRLARRILEHRAMGRPLAALDPEAVIREALQVLGMQRSDINNILRPNPS